VFLVSYEDKEIARLLPEKRRYLASGQIMTEAAIDATTWRDLYVALGDPIGDDAWAVRLHYKPMVRWLWVGALLIGLGAMITVLDRRYRTQRISEEVVAAAGLGEHAA
jgi:cytochrome c-type biogenesis protein CcmF